MVDLGLGVGKPAKPALAGEVVAVVKGGVTPGTGRCAPTFPLPAAG